MKFKLVAVAVAALVPVVGMLGYGEYAIRQQRGEEVRAQAAQAARQASSEVDRIVEGLRSLLLAVTSMPSVRHLDGPTCDEALKSLAGNVPNIRTIFVLQPDGSPVCGSMEMPAGTSFADRKYFHQAIETKAFVVGTYTKSRLTGDGVLPLAMPIVENDAVVGVVVSGIRLDWLQNRVTERGVAPGNAVTLADGEGTIVARVPLPERFVGTVIPDGFLKLINADQPGVVEVRSRDGTERVLGYRPIALPSSPLYVSAGFSTTEAFAPINRSTIINALGIVWGALAALVLSFYVGNRVILAPISRIGDVMRQWKAGETEARTWMKPSDELHAVGAALDDLLDQLETRRAEAERNEEERMLLVRELAHRVKNGFALVQAISRQTFARSDPERYQSFSERLTALAGTYDLILGKEGSASAIKDVLQAALKAHASDARRISFDGPDVVLPADVVLPLSLVVHELATNAIKYGSLGSDRGTVGITWTAEGGRVDLQWVESGGPAVKAPTRKGFGSVLIERALPPKSNPRTNVAFQPDGLHFYISFGCAEL
ncbi:histidine kinase [Rhizobium sp. XQZ8]|uniref:sensor histidine kinase n=1 Tax=Rhizobium populisoli TaxID=2859785 RepID=UPI001CA4E700|nr:HWE histidine kinase domain-containing protein [Rhizobium populisoli]MBW6425521.1 histidine kinase [Rhizobium populisoli]